MAISNSARAERIWAKIQRKPSSVVFTKPRVVAANGTVTPETALAAQTVRVNYDNRASLVEGATGTAPELHAIVYGVKGHPTVTDTNIAEGYTFIHEGDRFRVTDILPVPGGMQAVCVAIG